MEDWYCINAEQYALLMQKVTVADLVNERSKFLADEHPVSKVGLMTYIDDWHGKEGKHKFIFEACFNSLDTKTKLELLEYIEWKSDGYVQ